MSGDGMKDAWLWDYRGDLSYRLGRLQGYEKQMYSDIQELKKMAICVDCGEVASYLDVSVKDGEWKCWKHVPTDCSEYEYYPFL